MKQIVKPIVAMTAMVSMLSFGSCSNEDEVMSFSPEKSNQQGVDFVAEFTPQQEAALIETGNPYGEVAQKDSWTSAISADIPTCWGVFELLNMQILEQRVSMVHILPSIGLCFELSFFNSLKM